MLNRCQAPHFNILLNGSLAPFQQNVEMRSLAPIQQFSHCFVALQEVAPLVAWIVPSIRAPLTLAL
jgi:hypothetical protein